MQIERIRIQNYRCYEDTEIELNHPLLLVTGSNDGGKSALLQAIKIFLSSSKRDNPDPADFRLKSPDGDKRVDEMTISATVCVDGEETEYRKRISREGDEVTATYEEKVQVPADKRLRYVLENFMDTDVMSASEGEKIMKSEFGFTAEELASAKPDRFDQLKDYASNYEQVDDWQEVRTPDLPEPHYYESEEIGDPVKDVQKILEDNVGERVRKIREGKRYEEIRQDLQSEGRKQLKTLEEIFANYDFSEQKTELDPDLSVDLVKGLTLDALNVLQSGNKQSIEKMGAARRRKLLLALLEWRVRGTEEASDEEDAEVSPLFLLYDEPDTHFDYAAQRRLFTTLRRLSEKEGVQVIAATHSLNLIDRVKIDSLVHLNQAVGQNGVITTSVERLKDWDQIHEIARNLGLRNHVVLNACLLCSEGPTEGRMIPDLYEIYSGRSLHSIGVEMLRESQQGKNYSWALCKHVLRNNRSAFLLLDEDARTAEARPINGESIQEFNERVGASLIEEGSNLIYLGDVELEDVFDNHVLSEALIRYLRQRDGDDPLTKDDVRDFVQDARAADQGIGSYFDENLGPEFRTRFRKPDFGHQVVEVIREDPDQFPVPQELKEAFKRLEEYVDAA